MNVLLCNSYTMVCPPVRGDNPRALASALSPVHADKPWYNYFIRSLSMQTLPTAIYFVFFVFFLFLFFYGMCGIICG